MSVESRRQTGEDPTARPEAQAPEDNGKALDKAAAREAKAKAKQEKAREKRAKKAASDLPPPEPKVVGESKFDRVSSALMAWVIGVSLVVGWIGLMVWTQSSFADVPPPPLEIIEVEGSGGSPDGNLGETEAVNVSGAEAAETASNNMEDASAFEEPTIEMTTSAVIDALADVNPEDMTDVDIAEMLPNAQMVATGKKASRVGTGKAFGFGGGSGNGVPKELRWSIVFNPGQTTEEYARQLDYLKIELATPETAGTLAYAGNFSSASPTRRSGLAAADKRLYFLWQGAGRKGADVQLLARAGIVVGNKPVFQFIPEALEKQLSQLEVRYKNRQPPQIRKTRFQVVPQGGRYVVIVQSQDPLYEGQ